MSTHLKKTAHIPLEHKVTSSPDLLGKKKKNHLKLPMEIIYLHEKNLSINITERSGLKKNVELKDYLSSNPTAVGGDTIH